MLIGTRPKKSVLVFGGLDSRRRAGVKLRRLSGGGTGKATGAVLQFFRAFDLVLVSCGWNWAMAREGTANIEH